MQFIADLHVHSRFSIATSKSLNFGSLYAWAGRKGIRVVGTGDLTHPSWLEEMERDLIQAEEGLFKLTAEKQRIVRQEEGLKEDFSVRFILTGEISTIYSQGGRIRKIHHLVCLPTLESAKRLSKSLSRIGSVHSDGRPILGIDSRNLLEIVLESDPLSFLVPAHIWTPWFSVLGSKSGFDCIDECYKDLAHEIFAIETGLSSDPAMNWLVSSLDKYTIISNSDAHSPRKLGRESNILSCDLSFSGIRRALKGEGKDHLVETIEFFPEEGKYHFDGHRKCGVRMSPEETTRLGGICPVCGKKVTVGVMNRVMELADRNTGWISASRPGFRRLIPLEEVLSQVLGRGVQSKAVTEAYLHLIGQLGSEFSILTEIDQLELERVGGPLLAEAIINLRAGRVQTSPGYDGEFGIIRVLSVETSEGPTQPPKASQLKLELEPARTTQEEGLQASDLSQERIRGHMGSFLVVIAGPGSGKTHMLTTKMADRLRGRGSSNEKVVGITFTRAAARELSSRLSDWAPESIGLWTGTIHQFCHELLIADGGEIELYDEVQLGWLLRWELQGRGIQVTRDRARRIVQFISMWRNGVTKTVSDLPISKDSLIDCYQTAKECANVVDYDDLIERTNSRLKTRPWDRDYHIFVDEFQDLDQKQHELVTHLFENAGSVMVIGDPNQAIYGFRGADPSLLKKLAEKMSDSSVIKLDRSYRCGNRILAAADGVVGRSTPMRSAGGSNGIVELLRAGSAEAEARMVAGRIRQILGGTSLLDASDVGGVSRIRGFSDIAVLARTARSLGAFRKTLDDSGIPYRAVGAVPLSEDPSIGRFLSWIRLALHPGSLADRLALSEGSTASLVPRELTRSECCFLEGLRDLSSPKVVQALRRWMRAKENDLTDEQWAVLEWLGWEYPDLYEFVRQATMEREVGVFDRDAEVVRLMTIHGAKGLEFEAVFVVGFREGLLPLQGGDLEEERRLCYVAMTRAKSYLCLTWAGREDSASRFAADIPPSVLTRSKPRHRRAIQMELDL